MKIYDSKVKNERYNVAKVIANGYYYFLYLLKYTISRFLTDLSIPTTNSRAFNRKLSWPINDDKQLSKSRMNICIDPTVGRVQRGSALWTHVKNQF